MKFDEALLKVKKNYITETPGMGGTDGNGTMGMGGVKTGNVKMKHSGNPTTQDQTNLNPTGETSDDNSNLMNILAQASDTDDDSGSEELLNYINNSKLDPKKLSVTFASLLGKLQGG